MNISQSDHDTFTKLLRIVAALDTRFPNGNDIFQRVSRLTEEVGELAMAVNHREGMGIKVEKHGEATNEQLVKELQDVLRATLGIAKHYGVEAELEASVDDFYDRYKKEGWAY